MITALAQEFSAQGFSFELILDPLPQLSLRPMALYRAISNLMRNAVKYGGKQFSVRSTVVGANLHLSILDRGPGIPAHEAQRLKQPFTRLDEARSMHSGSGLGLAIVDRIAQIHGGELLLIPREWRWTGGANSVCHLSRLQFRAKKKKSRKA